MLLDYGKVSVFGERFYLLLIKLHALLGGGGGGERIYCLAIDKL